MLRRILLVGCLLAAARSAFSPGLICSTPRQFIDALYNPDVYIIWIVKDIAMVEADWDPYSTPVVLHRNVNISGTENDILMWPLFDLGFVTAKVMVGLNVTLTFSRLVLKNWRRGPHFQAPGIDLLATNPATANHSWDAMMPFVHLIELALIQRGCLAPEVALQVVGAIERPGFLPGNQSLTVPLPQPGCKDNPVARPLQQCWPLAFEFTDIVMYGFNFNGFNPVPAGYVLKLDRVPSRCESVLDSGCIAVYSVYTCFQLLYPNSNADGVSPAPSDSGHGSPPQQPLGATIGGVLGGVALLAVLGVAIAWYTHQRRSRHALHHLGDPPQRDDAANPPAAAASCGTPTVKSAQESTVSTGASTSTGAENSRGVHDAPFGPFRVERAAVSVTAAQGGAPGAGAAEAGSIKSAAPNPPPQSPQLRASTLISTLTDNAAAEPVTPLTPLSESVNLRLSGPPGASGGEVQLLAGSTLGKGHFGRVVEGRYRGQPVAVKLLNYGLFVHAPSSAHGGDGGGGGGVAAALEEAAEMAVSWASRPLTLSFKPATAAWTSSTFSLSAHRPERLPAAGEQPLQLLHFAGGGGSSGEEGEDAAAAMSPHLLPPPQQQQQQGRPAGAGEGIVTSLESTKTPYVTVVSLARGVHDGGVGGDAGGGASRVAREPVPLAVSTLTAANRRTGDGRGMGAIPEDGVPEPGAGGVCDEGGCDRNWDVELREEDAGVGGDACDGGGDAAAAQGPPSQLPSLRPADPAQLGLVQEVDVLARCRHPNVVRLLAACLTPPHMCLVMELMETSLERLLYGNGPTGNPLLPMPKVLHIAVQVAAGLEYLHPTIMHRDLKPANVLLQNASSPAPIVKLADFGLSRLQTSVLVTKHVGVGTVAYMAPETLSTRNIVVSHRVDIYALGVILWELLSGCRPWSDLDLVQIAVAVELRGQRPPLSAIPPDRCPPKLHSLISRCWDAVPERRPAAAEVAKELLQLQLMLAKIESGSGEQGQQQIA